MCFLPNEHQRPLIFKNMINNWPASDWTIESLHDILKDKLLKFRIGKRCYKGVQFETDCSYEEATVSDFLDWLNGKCSSFSPLAQYSADSFWCYADYKYMSEIFRHEPNVLNAVDWSVFGYENRNGEQSTIWIGSPGSYTPCHRDTYGYNLVAQVYGRKRWVLFPPDNAQFLYTTRFPFEESSVFSRVNVRQPDLKAHPLFQQVMPYVVELEAGEVLFVPHDWWHYVECIDTAISINTWIEMDIDHHQRLKESVSRLIAFSLMSCEDDLNSRRWLNSTEMQTSQQQNLQYIEMALSQVTKARSGGQYPCTNIDSCSIVATNIESTIDKVSALPTQRIDVNSQNSTANMCCHPSRRSDMTEECNNQGENSIVPAKRKRLSSADNSRDVFERTDVISEPLFQSNLCSLNYRAVQQYSLETYILNFCDETNDATDYNSSTLSSSSSSSLSSTCLTTMQLADVILDDDVVSLICAKLQAVNK